MYSLFHQDVPVLRHANSCKCLLTTVLVLLLAAIPLHAQNRTPGSPEESGLTESGTATHTLSVEDLDFSRTPQLPSDIKFDESYFSLFTYSWIDDTGAKRVSNLAEPATQTPQIIAFLREVYTNPYVPGYRYDHAWEMTKNLDGDNAIQGLDTNKYVVTGYEPGKNARDAYGLGNDPIVLPVEGCTALMVEVNDPLSNNLTTGSDFKDFIDNIKRITLITKQRYIDSSVSSENPGYLFNYVGTLNNFFIITKGNNRVPLDSNHEPKEGTAPFFGMFEEFSPSNAAEPTYGAYDSMNADTGHFQVDHNCGSVMGQGHFIFMSPKNEESHDYAVNFMFLLPDYRFYGDSRRKTADSDEFEWYTFYDLNHQPYFFFNKITAYISEVESVVRDGVAKQRFKINWRSTYNDIVGYHANEDFIIVPVKNDLLGEPLKVGEYIVTLPTGDDPPFRQHEDGSLTSRDDPNWVYIELDREALSYDVAYLIKGRRYLTDFEFIESNIVEVNIPGTTASDDEIDIAIDGNRVSHYDFDTQTNNYTHTIYMVGQKYNSGMSILKRHIRAPKIGKIAKRPQDNGAEGTVQVETDLTPPNYYITRGSEFILKRHSENESEETATAVGTLEITKILFDDRWTGQNPQWIYYGKMYNSRGQLINSDGVVVTDIEGYGDGEEYFKVASTLPHYISDEEIVAEANNREAHDKDSRIISLDAYTFNVDANGFIVEAGKNGQYGYLAKFVDELTVAPGSPEHVGEYHYFVDFKYAVATDNSTTKYDMNSNTVIFVVPKNDLKVGYIPYNQLEIMMDSEYSTRLRTTNPAIQFSVTTNPNISTYTLYELQEEGTETRKSWARATRMPSGRLMVETRNKNNVYTGGVSLYPGQNKDAVVETEYGVQPGKNYVLVTQYTTGNTYGNPIRTMYELPRPVIEETRVNTFSNGYWDGQYHYWTYYNWHSEYPEDAPEGEQYTHVGYRAWHRPHFESEKETAAPHSSMYVDEIFSADYQETANTPVHAPMQRIESTEETGKTESRTQLQVLGFTGQPDEKNPLNLPLHVRLYTELPASMTISKDGSHIEDSTETPAGYIISDASRTYSHTEYDNTMTGVDTIESDENAPVEYFNLQGLRISNPESGSIVIRRQGSKVEKIRII